MKELIEALTILYKYMSVETKYPTQCEHEVLYVFGVDKEMSEEDTKRLEELGFSPNENYDNSWKSYRFGSC